MLIRTLIVISLLIAAAPSSADGSHFKGLLDTAQNYFAPLTGAVKSVDDGIILSDINSSDGIVEGMRLSVLREGKTFVHPVTKEPLGRAEKDIGVAEVVEVSADGSRLRVLEGEALEGDILRRSSAPVQALFYQSTDVDWDVSEEYYLQLKDLERFEVLDTAPGSASDEEIAGEARRLNAEVAIVLSAEYPSGKMTLRQRLIWANDARELSSAELSLDDEIIKNYKIGDELFSPKKNVPLLTFRIPYSTNLVAVGDVDGDGKKELALSTGNDIKFYSIGLNLNPALEGTEIDNPIAEEHIWLEIRDLDGDGKDEVVLSALNTFKAVSYVYKFSEGGFSALFKKTNVFLRVLNGGLYGQEYSRTRGYKGSVFPVSLDGTGRVDSSMTLPKGINLYDFSPFPSPEGPEKTLAYDERGHVLLYGGEGGLLWKSGGVYSKPGKKYESEKMTEMTPSRKWSVKDRIIIRGDAALAIARKPLAKISDTALWYKGSKVVKLYWNGDSIGEATLIGNIPGKVLDYTVSDDKAFILIGTTFGIAPENILKGKSLFSTKLYIYSIKGS
jgi:hypothetical protein